MFEDCLFDDCHCYDENGNLKGALEVKPPLPIRLQWDFNDPQLVATVDEAFVAAQKIVQVTLNFFSSFELTESLFFQ